ncbi:MAG: cyclic pyranopterin monophosphate synthase MoaC [Bacteroidetes bacterium]|nr:cyclic pyranopterin monophosphate synthase MoaC [Bacteroidota bacterium]
MAKLTHTDEKGKASMVDVSAKPAVERAASAEGFISLSPQTLELISQNQMKKGDVLTVAEIAGIQAAKLTWQLIPLCHPLQLSHISVKTETTSQGVKVTSEARCTGPTGVEMEALTAVNVALLTIYDMCKAVDKHMEMSNIRLVYKTKSRA